MCRISSTFVNSSSIVKFAGAGGKGLRSLSGFARASEAFSYMFRHVKTTLPRMTEPLKAKIQTETERRPFTIVWTWGYWVGSLVLQDAILFTTRSQDMALGVASPNVSIVTLWLSWDETHETHPKAATKGW